MHIKSNSDAFIRWATIGSTFRRAYELCSVVTSGAVLKVSSLNIVATMPLHIFSERSLID